VGQYSRVNKQLRRRLRWFDEGAPILRLVLDRSGLGDMLPADGDFYACPCCLMAYPREAAEAGTLTEEHVPPKQLGGRSLLLTCKECNHTSGTNFDAHAVTRSHADDFVRGKVSRRALPVTFSADGIPVRGTVRMTDDGIQLFGIQEQNDQKVLDAHIERLKAYIGRGSPVVDFEFTVHTRFDETRSDLMGSLGVPGSFLGAGMALYSSKGDGPVQEPAPTTEHGNRADVHRPGPQRFANR
jgi:hypothetical protein